MIIDDDGQKEKEDNDDNNQTDNADDFDEIIMSMLMQVKVLFLISLYFRCFFGLLPT